MALILAHQLQVNEDKGMEAHQEESDNDKAPKTHQKEDHDVQTLEAHQMEASEDKTPKSHLKEAEVSCSSPPPAQKKDAFTQACITACVHFICILKMNSLFLKLSNFRPMNMLPVLGQGLLLNGIEAISHLLFTYQQFIFQ